MCVCACVNIIYIYVYTRSLPCMQSPISSALQLHHQCHIPVTPASIAPSARSSALHRWEGTGTKDPPAAVFGPLGLGEVIKNWWLFEGVSNYDEVGACPVRPCPFSIDDLAMESMRPAHGTQHSTPVPFNPTTTPRVVRPCIFPLINLW